MVSTENYIIFKFYIYIPQEWSYRVLLNLTIYVQYFFLRNVFPIFHGDVNLPSCGHAWVKKVFNYLLLTYPGNVSQVEQVVYLGWCRKHFSDDGVVDVNGGLKEKHNKINIGTQ